jgi:hypothetical protein
VYVHGVKLFMIASEWYIVIQSRHGPGDGSLVAPPGQPLQYIESDRS